MLANRPIANQLVALAGVECNHNARHFDVAILYVFDISNGTYTA
jgi:hypothetical protein